jgi:hypothetical protein
MNQAFPGATSNEILHADDSARLASLLDPARSWTLSFPLNGQTCAAIV